MCRCYTTIGIDVREVLFHFGVVACEGRCRRARSTTARERHGGRGRIVNAPLVHRNACHPTALNNRNSRCATTATTRYRYRGRARVARCRQLSTTMYSTPLNPRVLE